MNQEQQSARRLKLIAAVCTLVLALSIAGLFVLISTDGRGFGASGSSSSELQIGDVEPASQAVDEGVSEPEPEPTVVTLFAAGDVVVHSPLWESGRQEDGSFLFDHLFAHIADESQAADLALISQETILGGTELGLSGYPTFNGPFEIGDAEVAAGFDVILKASNHVLDKGQVGLESELAFWHENHPEIALIGMGTTQEEYEDIYVYEQEGLRVALLTYTYDTNGIPFPSNNPWATHLLDYDHEDEIREDIREAHELADLVIVWPHWGTEYQVEPDSLQRYYADVFCEEGVDVVIGSHPHTIEPVEVREREDGHKTLIFYSLGNFLSNQTQGVMTSIGAMVQLTLVKDGDDARVLDWVFEPTVTQRASGSNFSVWALADYTDELAAANNTPLTLQGCEDWCSQVLGENYDPATSTLSGTL